MVNTAVRTAAEFLQESVSVEIVIGLGALLNLLPRERDGPLILNYGTGTFWGCM